MIPDSIKDKVADKLLEIICEKIDGVASDSIKNKIEGFRSNKASSKDIQNAIEKAATRFLNEYHDKGVATALVENTRFYDLPTVQKAVKEYLLSPYSNAPIEILEGDFRSVLPTEEEPKIKHAVSEYMKILREELISIQTLHSTLQLITSIDNTTNTEEIKSTLETILSELKQLFGTQEGFLEAVRAKYLKYLITMNTYINTRGIMQTKQWMSIFLDDVYISLVGRKKEDYLVVDSLSESSLPEKEFFEENIAERAEVDTSYQNIGLELPDIIKGNNRIVILGDPGSGKSTILRVLAFLFAKSVLDFPKQDLIVKDKRNVSYGDVLFPIMIKLSEYADSFNVNPSKSIQQYLSDAFSIIDANPSIITKLFSHYLNDGKALILFDGLDEVSSTATRIKVIGRVEEFIASINEKNKVIMTSRIAGYRPASMGINVEHFVLEELSFEKIELFVNNWFAAVSRVLEPELIDSERMVRVKKETEAIVNTIRNNQGILRLARNPLLLTILCLIHRNGASLPHRRIELYQLATKTLLCDWRLANNPSANTIKESEAMRLLAPLAFWLYESRPSGLINETDLKDKLVELVSNFRNLPPDSQDTLDAVDDFLLRIREHSGIFVEKAIRKYGFLHLTFQEYFVAREIIRNRKSAMERINKYRHDPRWREPILLAVAYESYDHPDDASEWISSAILAIDSSYQPSLHEDVLHRDLLLAAQCVVEAVEVNTRLQEHVVQGLLRLYFNIDGEGRYSSLRHPFNEYLYYLSSSEIGDYIRKKFLASLQSENQEIKRYAIYGLGHLKITTDEVREALLLTLNDEDIYIAIDTAIVLLRLGIETSKAVDLLSKACLSNEWKVRLEAIHAFFSVKIASQDIQGIQELLFSLLKRFYNEGINQIDSITPALDLLKIKTPEIINFFKDALADNDKKIRVVSALRWYRSIIPDLEDIILLLLKDDFGTVRMCVAEALGYCQVSDKVINALLEATRDGDLIVRTQAIGAVSKVGSSSSEVLERLTYIVGDANEPLEVRSSALGSLRNVKIPDETLIGLCLEMISGESTKLRGTAINLINIKSYKEPRVINALVGLLQDSDSDIKLSAAGTLMKLKYSNFGDILSILISMLREPKKQATAGIYLKQLCENTMYSITVDQMDTIISELRTAIDNRQSPKNQGTVIDNKIYDSDLGIFWESLWIACQRRGMIVNNR